MGKERRKSTPVCLAAAFLITCQLVQTTASLRMTKTERRAAQKAFDVDVQEGEILFGDVSEKDSHVTDGTWKASSNSSVEDETSYQADFAGWTQPETDDAHMEKWNRMATSLHCFGDHLKFRSLGSGASQLEVEQENKQSMPLAMVPPKCGYKMHGNSMAFVMVVPYEGCNMIQQDGNYKLPLRWHGNPVSLLCPKRGKKSHHRRNPWPKYQVPQYPQELQYPLLPQEPQYLQIPQEPQEPQYPQEPQVPNYPQYPPIFQDSQVTKYPQVPQYPQIPQDPQVPQYPQEPKYPPVLQDPQISQMLRYPLILQDPQQPKYPQIPQEPQVPQYPQEPKDPPVLQDPQISQMLRYPLILQDPQQPKYPQIPQEPQVPKFPPEPKYPPILQDPQLPLFPQYPQMPQFPQEQTYPPLPQEPKVPQVTPAPQNSQLKYLPYLYAHPLFSYFYSMGAAQADLAQFSTPVYPQQAFSHPNPAATEPPTTSPPTSATKVTSYPQLPFDPYLMPLGPFVYDLPPYFPYPLPEYQKNPMTEDPQSPTQDMKTTAAPTTSGTPTIPSADTRASTDTPPFYPPEPFNFQYGQEFPQLFYPFQG